jgi:hypothetical protein
VDELGKVFSDLFAFGRLVVPYWGAYVVGGAPFVLHEGLKRLSGTYKRHVEQWSERNKSTARRIEITCLLAGLVFACFQAWEAEHDALGNAQASVRSEEQARALAQQKYADDEKAINEKGGYKDQISSLQTQIEADKNKPPKTIIEHTLGAPVSKDRSAYVGMLQKLYAGGGLLQARLLDRTITDDQIDGIEALADKWLNANAQWIQAHMGDAAARRFLNNTDKNSFSFNLDGQHKAGEKDKRDNILNSLAGCLTNLETLMKSNEFDPQ